MANLRAAIIGYGLAGRAFHAPLIASTSGLEIASIVTRNQQRGAQALIDHPGVAVLASVRAALDHKPDLVVVAAPNDAHAPTALAAIERGIAVVVDKPLAVSSEQAEALVVRAREAGVTLAVFQNRRWDTDHLALRALLAQDALGAVIRYESRFERWRPDTAPDWGRGEEWERGRLVAGERSVPVPGQPGDWPLLRAHRSGAAR